VNSDNTQQGAKLCKIEIFEIENNISIFSYEKGNNQIIDVIDEVEKGKIIKSPSAEVPKKNIYINFKYIFDIYLKFFIYKNIESTNNQKNVDNKDNIENELNSNRKLFEDLQRYRTAFSKIGGHSDSITTFNNDSFKNENIYFSREESVIMDSGIGTFFKYLDSGAYWYKFKIIDAQSDGYHNQEMIETNENESIVTYGFLYESLLKHNKSKFDELSNRYKQNHFMLTNELKLISMDEGGNFFDSNMVGNIDGEDYEWKQYEVIRNQELKCFSNLFNAINRNTSNFDLIDDLNYIYNKLSFNYFTSDLSKNNERQYIERHEDIFKSKAYQDNLNDLRNLLSQSDNKVINNLFSYEDPILPENSISDFLKDEPLKFLTDLIKDYLLSALTKSRKILNSIDYIPSVRNTVKRNYSLSGNENYFIEILKKLSTVPFSDKSKIFLNKYVQYFDIASSVKIDISEDGSSNIIYLLKDGKKLNLADLGYGISQLLPILLRIVLSLNENNFKETSSSSILIIEEPETNLHPALQSKLAEMFIDCYKNYNIQFILETHSEYLIRKLQYLTAKKEIRPEDTQIYYFYPPDDVPEGENQMYPINILEDGSLDKNFGKGFFDEADNIALELFLLKNHQSN
jgi:hypothetical protein